MTKNTLGAGITRRLAHPLSCFRSVALASSSSTRYTFLLGILSAGIAVPALHAQYDTAAVLGYVHDPAGAAVVKAKVRLVNQATGESKETLSNAQGGYEFPDVKVGSYRVVATQDGFGTTTTETFMVAVSARQRVDVGLNIGSAADVVTVTDAASLLESESSNRGQVIEREQIVELPLNGRTVSNLALLAPGVRQSTKTREGAFNINGMRQAYNNYILDGVDNNAYGTSNQGYSNQVIQLSPDAIQEFRIDTNNYSAEYGRAAGGVINATIRTGTNQFHGAAWEFMRNTVLNAGGYFKPSSGIKPTLVQNQFGGAVGGPILRKKIFFFADYEGFRSSTTSLSTITVPTLDQRAGRFTTAVKNPYTGQIYTNGVIPASVLNQFPFGTTVLAALPAPNVAGAATNNYTSLPKTTSPGNKGDFRYDQTINDKLSIFGRYSVNLNYINADPTLPGDSGGGSDITRTYNRQIALGATWTINSRSVLDVRFGLTKTEGSDNKSRELDNSQNMQQLYGITGLPTTKPLAGGLNDQSITGYQQMGRDSGQHQNPDVINPKVNYSRIAGKHTLKAGFEFQHIATEIVDFNPMYGKDTYAGQFSNPSSSTNNTVYNVADFLMGARNTYTLNTPGVANYIQKMYFGYVQDDWRATSKLTLNLGFRYEFATPQFERDNKLSNFDPATDSMISASSGSLYNRALVHPDPWNLGPRLGGAYSLNSKTVLRGGYGIGYMHFNRYGGENLLAYNTPFVLSASITQQPSQGLCANDLNPASCFRPTQMGYPANFLVVGNTHPATLKIHYSPSNTKQSRVQSWHFGVQRELPGHFVLDAAYVGNAADRVLMLGDFNQATPNAVGQNIPVDSRRPYQGYGIIEANFDGGYGHYNALQTRLQRQYANGLYLLNTFVWSKGIDNGTGSMEASAGDDYPVNYRDLNYTRGVSGYNQPLNDTTTIIWDIPVGKNGKYLTSIPSWENAFLGGWQTAFINTMTSGQPVNFMYSPSSQATVSSMPIYRPNLIGDPNNVSGGRTIKNYFNASAFSIPSIATPFGNTGRNTAKAPAYYNLDFSIHKRFYLPVETSQLEFRAEFFNLLNKTNFQPPASNISSSSFGAITSNMPARQAQFGLKLVF